jgi:hypothetical protein
MQVGLAVSQWDIANIFPNKLRQIKRAFTRRDLKNSSQWKGINRKQSTRWQHLSREYGTQSSPRPGLPDDVRKWVHFSKTPFLL